MGSRLSLGWGPLRSTHVPPTGGETEEEILRVDMLENQVMDFRMSLVMICYNPDFVSVPMALGAPQQRPPVGRGLLVPWGLLSTAVSCRRSSSRVTWSSSRGS